MVFGGTIPPFATGAADPYYCGMTFMIFHRAAAFPLV